MIEAQKSLKISYVQFAGDSDKESGDELAGKFPPGCYDQNIVLDTDEEKDQGACSNKGKFRKPGKIQMLVVICKCQALLLSQSGRKPWPRAGRFPVR